MWLIVPLLLIQTENNTNVQLVNGLQNQVTHVSNEKLPSNKKKLWYDILDDLKGIPLNERSQSYKVTYCMILFLWYCQKDKTVVIGNTSVTRD